MAINLKDTIIDGSKLQNMFRLGSLVLGNKKKEIDSLNVFPVPDGDTGTNMNLTFRSAFQSAEKVQENSIYDVAAAASAGSLMGARGNSGVILSQIMRGIAKGLEGIKEATVLQFASALQTGVDTAYRAVMKPVEGTILTVSREMAKAAVNKAKSGERDVLTVIKAGYQRGEETLARTPEMLPALKQAGVVDAGGYGFLTIVSGWIAALEGKSWEEVQDSREEPAEEFSAEGLLTGGITAVEDLKYPYCTEFLLKGSVLDPQKIREGLLDKGDNLLVVGTDEVVKIHVHTKNPGSVLEHALRFGSLHEVQIHNMLAQNEAAAHKAKQESRHNQEIQGLQGNTSSSFLPGQEQVPPARKEYGIVAVAMGEGIAEVFGSLGVDRNVSGGQTMNPSTSDLAEAVSKVDADNVFILPNNSNIIMAAEQVNQVLDDRQVFVIPTKSAPQAIAALLAFNSDIAPGENVREMTKALDMVTSGEITYAIRNSSLGELEIAEGDILGLIEGRIITTGRDILEVAEQVFEAMNWREKDLVTVFYGKDTPREDVEQLAGWLNREKPGIEVEIYSGKQPLYYYIVGVE